MTRHPILALGHAYPTRMEGVPYDDRLHAYGSLILREEQPHRSALCATAYTGTVCPIRIHAKRVVRYATLEAGGIVFATL